MVGRAGFVVIAVAALALAAALGVAQAGGDERTAARASHNASPRLVVARFTHASARGVVFAVRHGALRRVALGVSLHQVDPNETFEVVGLRAPCSRAVAGADLARLAGFRTTVLSVEAEDVWEPVRVPLRGSLGATRSIRLYAESGEGSFVERACAPAGVFIGGGAATGALVG